MRHFWLIAIAFLTLIMPAIYMAAERAPTAPVTGEGDGSPKGLGPARERTAPVPGRRWALLIGVDKYSSMPALQYCGRDMRVLRTTLIEHGGYEPQRVQLLTDAPEERSGIAKPATDPFNLASLPTKGSIMIALDSFLRQAQPEDTVLIAFSGHGASDDQRRSYLMPIDGNPRDADTLSDTGISIERIHKYLAKCQARQKVLIIDACHSGGQKSDKPLFSVNPAEASGGAGLVEMLSCDVEQFSWESDALKQGVFSYYLADGLRGRADEPGSGNGDGRITFDELYEYTQANVRQHVLNERRQTQTPKKRGEVIGTFVRGTRPVVAPTALSPEQVMDRLKALQKARTVSADFATAAEGWLAMSPTFGPAKRVQLLLSLLAREVITKEEFDLTAREAITCLTSHTTSEQAANSSRLRAVIVGINDYRGLRQTFCVNEAHTLRSALISGQVARPEDVHVMTDAEATKKKFIAVVGQQAQSTAAGDVLLVYFAGHGARWPKVGAVAAADEPQLQRINLDDTEDFGNRGVWLTAEVEIMTTFDTLLAAPLMKGSGKYIKGAALRPGKSTPEGVIVVDDLLQELATCKGHILFITSAGYAWPDHLPSLISPSFVRSRYFLDDQAEMRESDSRANAGPARVFIGYYRDSSDSAVLKGSDINYHTIKGLGGEADLNSPLLFDGNLLGASRRSDGFVSLREFVQYMKETEHEWLDGRHRGRDVDRWKFFGHVGDSEAILTRSRLAVD